ncbi:hypothetical protein PMI01_00291 [Caulobacter sp. AP07]|uniref:DUF4349 domain-containing protein n=1 Tax=Caulobacter sp. AP07 TaxID=1144304 RepID=UPI0002720B86|nr:DUF4349 domain-containing protein [Caulobacter sp. AP07]EJL38116.1 hypothetical protein PMI01_00291 [Caulobacter sp. AP07]
MRAVTLVIMSVVLAGCSRMNAPAENYSDAAVMMEAPPAVAKAASSSTAPVTQDAPSTPSGPMIAYDYTDTIWAPSGRIKALMDAHQQACVAAGPAACQVIGSNRSGADGGVTTAMLSLRASPAWIAKLRGGLDADAKAAGGRVTASQVTSEDLTRSIVDGEARLRAQTALRDRLQKLLAERPGKLAELLEVERELARVQGEIDSAVSTLAVMKTRVATSALTLNYESGAVTRPTGAWAPLAQAFADVGAILARSLAGLVLFIAWAAPWILVLGLLIWALRKRLPRLGRKPPKTPD